MVAWLILAMVFMATGKLIPSICTLGGQKRIQLLIINICDVSLAIPFFLYVVCRPISLQQSSTNCKWQIIYFCNVICLQITGHQGGWTQESTNPALKKVFSNNKYTLIKTRNWLELGMILVKVSKERLLLYKCRVGKPTFWIVTKET